MKRFTPVIAFAFLLSVLTLPLWAVTTAKESSTASDRSPVAPIAGAVTAVTGIAISPLLGTAAYGAYLYVQAEEGAREQLPWFAQMSFWLPALGLVGAVALKDAAGAVLPPGWKKPLDVLETLENKATGLVAAGAVVPFTMAALSKMMVGGGESVAAQTVDFGGVGMLHLAAVDWSWLLNILTVPAGIAIYLVVFLASHAINGLILLSPWGAIDAALKSARTALLGLLVLSAQMDPWIAVGVSAVVIIFAYFIAGWSFRLSVFSSIFCWDFFTLRRGRFTVASDANKLFAGTGLGGAPQRTYGRLVKGESGSLEFAYKPWLVLPERRTPVPSPVNLAVGRGSFFSNVTDGESEVLVLPPRYRGHEDDLATVYGCERGVEPIGLNKAWSWLSGATGVKTSKAAA